ncbi:MAG: response regulator transcription factor [Reyranella sp.]|jgi:FixJ family two-component response regulator|uniref:response regulator transcription factor n=1 Tax=Reyranella sp. TaxID=1929291 RepID=UPI00096273B9|nr:response regulator transcription factor [Reyranella sp.]MBN9541369.1 response regulator transcription factor [Alphaproteobacteria bacterium]MBR2813360.1 response regulator transcription factor [Reyranella sp.]OJU46564.1 MAG: DNA-binding response regulator [Alphaproteobacteria bacterium 65-37]
MVPSGAEAPLVIIVDDDEAVRLALVELMESVELDAVSFGSTRKLLEADLPDRPGCLILDVRMPGLSGLDLQSQLASSGDAKPVIFVSGHGDIPMTVQAMKAGAIDFLTKPVRGQAVLDAVKLGIERDIAQRAVTRIARTQASRFGTLTTRERQVMKEVARGRLNKQIAFDLGISQITVKVHRANMMRKMQTTSVGELVRAWEALPAQLRADRPAEHRI